MFPYEKRSGSRHRRSYSVSMGPYPSLTVDVSAAGFCARAARALPRGADVEGAIKVGGRWVPFGGRVAWCDPDTGSARVGAKIGVRFTRVPWDLQRLLER